MNPFGRYAMAVLLLITAVGAGGAADLRAGAAHVDLTPPLEMKASLGGYGARMSQPAIGVHDQVWIKALVIADDDRRFALVTADALAFPPGVKERVVEALADPGWRIDNILLLPSHCHTSIDLMAIHPGNRFPIPQIGLFQQELLDWTVARLAQAITEAGRDLEPVQVGTGRIRLDDWNRNRRQGNTAHNPDLTVTRIDRTDGGPLVVLVHWAAHPTFMDAEDMLFSGGWPGHLQRTLEALIGQGVTAMYYNGAEADQSPVGRGPAGSNWERAQQYGLGLGIEAWRAWQQIRPQPAANFAFHLEVIDLPERTWHPDFMLTGGAEYGLSEDNVRPLLEALFPERTHSLSLRLGDLLIVGVPGELAGELGMALTAQVSQASGAPYVVIGGLADEWVSYMLSPEEYRKGGYEASVSFYGETLGPVIIEAVMSGTEGL